MVRFSFCPLFLLMLVAFAGCQREKQVSETAVLGQETPVCLYVSDDRPVCTRSMVPVDGDNGVVKVSRVPMGGVVTRSFVPVGASSLTSLYVSVVSGSEVKYQNRVFSRSNASQPFTSDLWWPATSVSYAFYVSNAEMSSYHTLSLDDDSGDVVAGSASPVYRTSPAVTLEHVFASLGTLTVEAPSGISVELLSASVEAPVAGVWDLAAGSWESTGIVGDIDLEEGDNGILVVPGTHTLYVECRLTKGSDAQDVSFSDDIAIRRGMVNNITVTLGSTLETVLEVTPQTATVTHGSRRTFTAQRVTRFIPNDSSEDPVILSSVDVTSSCIWSSDDASVVKQYSANVFQATDKPGTAHVRAKYVSSDYGTLEGQATVTVADYETGIEVRNLEVDMSQLSSEDCEDISPAGADIQFGVDFGFEYRKVMASGAKTAWKEWNEGEDSFFDERLRNVYGFSAGAYLYEADEGFSVTDNEGDFWLEVQPNYSSSPRTAYVGFGLKVSGSSASAAEIYCEQRADAVVSSDYRNLKVTLLAGGRSTVTEGPASHAVQYTSSCTVEQRNNMESGRATGWFTQTLSAPAVSIVSGSGWMTLQSGKKVFLSQNTTGVRTGRLRATKSYQGLSASAELTVTQTKAEIDHTDYANLSFTVTCNTSFSPLGSTSEVLSIDGTYSDRIVYDGIEPDDGDWVSGRALHTDKPSGLYIVSGGSTRAITSSDWITYSSSTGRFGVRPNYTGYSRSVTVRVVVQLADEVDCFCDDSPDGGWVANAYRDVVITQAPTTVSTAEFRLRSPGHPGATGFLAYDDCVLEMCSMTTEHGKSVLDTETDASKLSIWNSVDFRIDEIKVYFTGGSRVPSDGDIALSPGRSSFAGARSVTWNNVRKALIPNNTSYYEGFMFLRYTREECSSMPAGAYNHSVSDWNLFLKAAVTVRLGSGQTAFHTGNIFIDEVAIRKMEFKNASITVYPEGCTETYPGWYTVSPGVSTLVVNLWGQFDARYQLSTVGENSKLKDDLGWSGYETVKFTNISPGTIPFSVTSGVFVFYPSGAPHQIIGSRSSVYEGDQVFSASYSQGSLYITGQVGFMY